MEMQLVFMFMKPVLMDTRMMEMEIVSCLLLVVDKISLMMEMEIVSLLLKSTSLSTFYLTHQEDLPDVTQLVQNVNSEGNVPFVKLVMVLILLQSNAFIAMDVSHAMEPIPLNALDVSILKSSTELQRPVLKLYAVLTAVFNAI